MEIEIIIRDEAGQIINEQTSKKYQLGAEVTGLSQIEGVVEELKQKMLPAIEADLLKQAQSKVTHELKKRVK